MKKFLMAFLVLVVLGGLLLVLGRSSSGPNASGNCVQLADRGTPSFFANPCGIVYSTPGATGNTSITSTTMVTVPAGLNPWYQLSFYVFQVAAGTSCSTNTTIATNVIFQDPSASGATTLNAIDNFSVSGNGGVNTPATRKSGSPTGPYTFQAKAGTVVQWSDTYTAGTGCSPAPTVTVTPILEQL